MKRSLKKGTFVLESSREIRSKVQQLLAECRPVLHDSQAVSLRKSSLRLLYLLGLGAYLAYPHYDAWA